MQVDTRSRNQPVDNSMVVMLRIPLPCTAYFDFAGAFDSMPP